MKPFLASAALLTIAITTASLFAAEKPYEKAQIVEIEKKAHTRVLYYLVNTPVTQDDPYYEISLQLNDGFYVTEYTPRHAADSWPEDWKSGAEVQAKLTNKRHISMKGPGGREVELVVVKRVPATPETTGSKPTSPKN